MFMFDRCHHSSAVVTPVKYEFDLINLSSNLQMKTIANEKKRNRALVTPTPDHMVLEYISRNTPMVYALLCFVVVWYQLILLFTASLALNVIALYFGITSQTLGQSCDGPRASESTLKNTGK